MEATIDYVISGRTETQRMSFSVERTGNVSIEPPDWVDTARDRTAGD